MKTIIYTDNLSNGSAPYTPTQRTYSSASARCMAITIPSIHKPSEIFILMVLTTDAGN